MGNQIGGVKTIVNASHHNVVKLQTINVEGFKGVAARQAQEYGKDGKLLKTTCFFGQGASVTQMPGKTNYTVQLPKSEALDASYESLLAKFGQCPTPPSK